MLLPASALCLALCTQTLYFHESVILHTNPTQLNSVLALVRKRGVETVVLVAQTGTTAYVTETIDKQRLPFTQEDESNTVLDLTSTIVCSSVQELAQARRLGATTLWVNSRAANEPPDRGGFLAYAIVRDLADFVVDCVDDLATGIDGAEKRALEKVGNVKPSIVQVSNAVDYAAPEMDVSENKFCVHCGTSLPVMAHFCSACGEPCANS